MKRVLLKLSGEALAGDKHQGFDEPTVTVVANQVKKIDGYIYGETVIPRKEPKVEKKAEAAPAPAAPEKKPEAKAPEAKAPEVKASEKKPAPKAEPKPAQPAQKKPVDRENPKMRYL